MPQGERTAHGPDVRREKVGHHCVGKELNFDKTLELNKAGEGTGSAGFSWGNSFENVIDGQTSPSIGAKMVFAIGKAIMGDEISRQRGQQEHRLGGNRMLGCLTHGTKASAPLLRALE